jgi:hypothetical protein
LAVEMTRGPMNLVRVTPSGVIEPVTVGSGSDWDAVAAHDGMIAHISNRTGSYQVWLTGRGAESVRLTSLLASYMTTPAWSPDDKTIAFVAVQGHRGELYTVARDGSQLRRLTDDGFEKQNPVYSPAGDRIFYIARDERRWHLMQVGVAPGSRPQPVPGGEGWGTLRTDGAGHLYGQRGLSIVTLDPAAPLIDVGLTEIDVWAVGPQGIYVRRGGETQRRAIWFYPWREPARKLVATPYAAGMISVDNDGAVMFSQSPDYQVDIGRIELRSGS